MTDCRRCGKKDISKHEELHLGNVCFDCRVILDQGLLCEKCNGKGMTEELRWDKYGSWDPVHTTWQPCSRCNGKGRVYETEILRLRKVEDRNE